MESDSASSSTPDPRRGWLTLLGTFAGGCGILFLLAVLGVWWISSARAPEATEHEIRSDLEYATADGEPLVLDLYLPSPRPADPVPLVLWVHGGGWQSGSKTPTNAPAALGSAYAVASVEYRLTDVATFPAQIHDVKAAVRWLRAHAREFGIDPDRIGAWGSSAGGHLVALLGTSCGVPELEGELGDHTDQPSGVQAVCDFYGPTDLVGLLDLRKRADTRSPTPEELLLGGPLAEHVELARLASPISHVDAGDPPFLIMHGSADPTVPVEQSVDFAAALEAAGVEVSLVVVTGAGHGLPRSILPRVKLFFDQQLTDRP